MGKSLTNPVSSKKTPVEINGRLSVKGTKLVNEKGEVVRLKGVSTHGIGRYPEYVNIDSFRTLRDQWNADLIRLAMYTEEFDGYCISGKKEELKDLVHEGVQCATELGMYVIIDWHILSDGHPAKNQAEAEAFFEQMSARYKDHKNVIYEICNEPNSGPDWPAVRKYAEAIIKIIRNHDKEAIILVGTPTWSQDVDIAADDPVKGYSNIMYVLHFYAGTHREPLRDKARAALQKGLPLFVSEFGISDASGDGELDKTEGDIWIRFLRENDISFVCWNLSNKAESSALLNSASTVTGNFTDKDLSEQGMWYRNI